VPCIVEHAGLVFDELGGANYPAGLTKPMWNELKDHFAPETRSADRRATAQAMVAYCDGMSVRVFSGVTTGRLSDAPRGSRSFYWDTLFIPDDPKRPGSDLTYAQIVEDGSLGLPYKMVHLSQSGKAMMACLEFIRITPLNRLWA
jgi:XTP/dITP diphosphohydrolase